MALMPMKPLLQIVNRFKTGGNPLFDAQWYTATYADVGGSGVDPWRHYLRHGRIEGRNPNPFFDARWYLETYPDVTHTRLDPLDHYWRLGAREGRDPGPDFSTTAYLENNPDVAIAGVNPLLHYLRHGHREGRSARPFISTAEYLTWIERNDTLTEQDRSAILVHIDTFRIKPLISVLIPVYNTNEAHLRELLDSLLGQLYRHWEACIADDASKEPHVQRVLKEYAARDARIRPVLRPENGHISRATNSALQIARGDFVALVDHDDLVPEHALYEVAAEIELHPDADILYSDQDQIDENGSRSMPFFKTDWNRDLLLGQNMVNHLGVYRRSLIETIGGLRSGFEGSQDYDLTLRASEATSAERIRHIPTVLYHWRQFSNATNFSRTDLERCIGSARRAIAEHLERRGEAADVLPARHADNFSRVRRALPAPAPKVSVIIPTRDQARMLARCVDGVLERTDYASLELIIVDNDSVEADTFALFDRLKGDPRVKVIACPGPFNFSAMNNRAVEIASGDVVVLLNNDVEVIEGGWLREMIVHALRPEIGAVGAKLLYPNGRLQHGGVILGAGGVAEHYFLHAHPAHQGYYYNLFLTRRVSCVTAACIAVRRSVYLELGGLDEVDFQVAYNDVDFCIRLARRGYQILWTPDAELYHHESISRGSDQTLEKVERFRRERDCLVSRWSTQLAHDAFYNPNLSLTSGEYGLAETSRRIKPWLMSRSNLRKNRES